MNTTQTFTQSGAKIITQSATTQTQPAIKIQSSNLNVQQVPDQNIEGHVHEFEGSVKLAEECDDRHNHRFAGVTSEMIEMGDNHVHGIFVNTDFLDHHHQIAAISGFAIDVGNNQHVHVIQSTTSTVDGHFHDFIVATLIPRPLV